MRLAYLLPGIRGRGRVVPARHRALDGGGLTDGDVLAAAPKSSLPDRSSEEDEQRAMPRARFVQAADTRVPPKPVTAVNGPVWAPSRTCHVIN